MKHLVFGIASLIAATGPSWAAPPPSAAVTCLIAADPMVTEYRSPLQLQCVQTALMLCLAQQGTIACIDAVNGVYRDLFYQVRVELPDSIPPGGYQPRLYKNALRRMDRAFASDRPCGDVDEMEQARCRYYDLSRAILDVFTAARAAGITISDPAQAQ